MACALAGPRGQVGLLEGRRALAVAPDHRRVEAAGATCRIPGSMSGQAVGGDRLALALERERLERLDLDRVSHEPVRRLAEQDLARGRRFLEPLGDVDGVAGGESLAAAAVAGNHLARVDAGPHLDPDAPVPLELVVQGGEPFAHLGGGADRAERVVLVDDRNPEDGHHRVADELLDDVPSWPLDDRLHLVEVAAHDAPQRFRVELLAERGRAGHIREDDR